MKFFENRLCFVVTLHGKERAIRGHFASMLGMKTIEFPIDTDQFGTFSAEVERKLPPLLCAKQKCLAALAARSNEEMKGCVVGSEGTFGPHPLNPFAVCGHEILYFIDGDQQFELAVSEISCRTNFSAAVFDQWNEVEKGVLKWGFPSHSLVVRPDLWVTGLSLFKGVRSLQELKCAFEVCQNGLSDAKVRIETDMRAHHNPTRMEAIGQLAHKLACRLSALCPACATPGWGVVRQIPGLICADCGFPTELTQSIEWGCPRCLHVENRPREDGKSFASAQYCSFCNP